MKAIRQYDIPKDDVDALTRLQGWAHSDVAFGFGAFERSGVFLALWRSALPGHWLAIEYDSHPGARSAVLS